MGFITGTLLFAGGVAFGGVVATKATIALVKEAVFNSLNRQQPKYRSYHDLYGSRPCSYTKRIDDIVFSRRGDADAVLDEMDEIISKYGLASVADLYELAGVTSNFTDQRYGWTTTRNARVIRVYGGYAIELPKPTHI